MSIYSTTICLQRLDASADKGMHLVRWIFRGGSGLLTYCGYEGGIEGVLAEPEQQTCLADSAVSDEQQLE